jgi:hypothetical protein
MDDLTTLRRRQSGVVSRAQLVAHAVSDTEMRRLIRRERLTVVVPGVYVDHNGPLTWVQQAWVGVLAVWPAALCHRSALRADDGPGRRGSDAALHVAVDRDRSPASPPGVRLHRMADLDGKVQWNLGPPRVRIEHAVLDVAAGSRDELEAIAVLADAVQARRTTAARLAATLASRQRISRRRFLTDVLSDIDEGACSVLEHGYLTRVERPHGLPRAGRQVRASSRGPIYRDVAYRPWDTFVELDGRLFHDDARARDADLERDLDAAVTGGIDVRLGWGQVFGRACSTAHKIGLVLNRRGWDGSTTSCPGCSGVLVRYAAATG